MAIRISGLSSGLDTESLVSELVSAYSIKKDNYVKAQTKLGWKQDAWKALNKKVYSLYSNISSMRYSSAYSLKKTTVSDATKATVTAASNAVNGTQRLKITSLAAAGYLTGGQLRKTDGSTSGITSSTKLSDLKGKAGGETSYGLGSGENGTINVNGKEISLSGDDTVGSVVNKLKDAGVNASYDEKNNRIFVSSKNSGTANEFTLTASNDKGAMALQSLGLMVSSNSATAANRALKDAYTTNGSVDYGNIARALEEGKLGLSSYNSADYIQNVKAYNYAKEIAGGSTASLDGYNSYLEAKNRMAAVSPNFNASAYKSLSDLQENNPEALNLYFDTTTGSSLTKEEWDNLSEEQKNQTKDDGTAKYKTGTAWLTEQEDLLTDKYASIEDYEADRAAIAAYEKAHDADDRAALSKVKTAYAEDNTMASQLTYVEDDSNNFLNAAAQAFGEKVSAAVAAIDGEGFYGTSDGATRVDATDATIYLNGAEFTSNSNTFNINGLTINAAATTGTTFENAEEISITTNTDSQAIYDKVKDFLSQYNELVNEMSSLYNAASAKGYEPLTKDEKAALTDTQVEEWEDKVKSALLRRDGTLDGILSSMTSSMHKTYMMGYNANGSHITLTAQKDGTYKGNDNMSYTLKEKSNGNYTFLASDGKTEISAKNYAWSTFGINTLGILNSEANQQHAYHIDGDADDTNTNGNRDKLMAAINNDPDAVIDFLKNATSSLYDSINKKMSSTSMRTAYTVYNDKQMAKEYSDYSTTIKRWEDKVAKIEDSYYKKFAAMEKALTTLQGNQSAMGGLFG